MRYNAGIMERGATRRETIVLGLRPVDAAHALGSRVILEEMVAAGWLTPAIRRHKLTLYDAGEVRAAWERLVAAGGVIS